MGLTKIMCVEGLWLCSVPSKRSKVVEGERQNIDRRYSLLSSK